MLRIATAMLLAGLALSGCKSNDDKKPGTETAATGDTSITQTTLPPDPRVTASGPITCETPSARQTQVFNRQVLGDAWEKEAEYRTPAWSLAWGGRGVAVADFTGDGIPDILVPRELFPAEFLVGHADGTYTGATQTAFGGVELLNHNGASAADIDGDGDMDGMLYGLMGTATLLWNDGSGAFTVETREDWDTGDSGFGCGHSASWADYDRDGDLDLFYGRLGGTSPYDGSVFF